MKWMGVDESGKGDYFGYLVIAGVLVDDEAAKKLKVLGVKDSKSLSDASVHKIAAGIKKICRHDIVRISPEKYNMLYKNFKSLNRLLAWGHAQAIENLLQKNACDYVIVDKFGDEKYVSDAVKEKERTGRIKGKVKLVQKIRAESDPAVAAASVLARAEFLSTLKKLSMEIGYSLPKGATHVEESARHLVEKHGEEVLDFVAKRHFRTTARVLGRK